MRRSRLVSFASTVLLGAALIACTETPGGSPSGASPTGAGDIFEGLTYRLDLPADWIILGTAAFDTAIDTAPDVTGWLRDLELSGPNAFRAYEALPDAAGLRLAINPPVGWDTDSAGPLDNAELLAALPGVMDEPVGEWVAVGTTGKASRFRWTQSLDWGTGSPSARSCVGYQVATEFDPVNVVFTYPVGTDRLSEVEALMTTFAVLGNPAKSLPPGATPTPSPTPYDKYGSPEPVPTHHSDPALEALLPDTFDGKVMTKSSRTGTELGMTETDPLMKAFGKLPSDIAGATAVPSEPPLLIISVTRLRGVTAEDLLAAMLSDMPDAKVSQVTLDGRPVTYVMSGAWPVWYFATGEYLYGVAAIDEATAARVLALLN